MCDKTDTSYSCMLDMNPYCCQINERPFSLREKDRMRGFEFMQLLLFYPLFPALSLREREFMGQL